MAFWQGLLGGKSMKPELGVGMLFQVITHSSIFKVIFLLIIYGALSILYVRVHA